MPCVGDSILESYEGPASNYENAGTTAVYIYQQSFTIPDNADICAVSIYGGYGTVGARGTLKIEITDALTGGTVLATTGSFPDSDFNSVYTSPSWTKFELTSPVSLVSGTTYYIKITPLTGSGNDVYRWGIKTGNPYTNGQWYYNTSTPTTHDGLFRIHGVAGGGGVTPNNSARRQHLMMM